MAREPFSRGDLLLFSAVLAVGGIAVAGYLTFEWYTAFGSSVCDLNNYFSCAQVGKSPYAAVAGVPTSLLGFGGFVLLLVLSVLALRGTEWIGPWSVDGWIFLFAVLGALVGFGLTLIEIFVIQAVCVFCAIGFVLDLGILALAWSLRRGASAAAA